MRSISSRRLRFDIRGKLYLMEKTHGHIYKVVGANR